MTELTIRSMDGDSTVINMGPQHPSTHGVINLRLALQGEIIAEIDPQVGYLHRGLEKMAEMTPYPGFMPYTDRIDYLAAMFCNQAWAMSVERLLGLEVPRKAEYMRVIACELNRIINHLIAVAEFNFHCTLVVYNVAHLFHNICACFNLTAVFAKHFT